MSNSSCVMLFQSSPMGEGGWVARYLMYARKARRIPRWAGPMGMGARGAASPSVAATKVRFSISVSIRDPKSLTLSIMALASDLSSGPSSGWFRTVRTTCLRAASPWARVSGIVSDCSRRVSTVEVFEC